MAQDPKSETIQTPGGEVTYTEKSMGKEGFKDRVEPLLKDELAVLQRYADRAPEFIAAFVPREKRKDALLDDLDTAFAAWLKSGNRDTFSNDDVIHIVGAALGNYCIQHLGLRWALITDKDGTATALVSDNPPTRSFPFTSVQYRIEDNKTDFIYALYASLEHIMKESKK